MSLFSQSRHRPQQQSRRFINDQSRYHNRGPLIAVIKIELDEDNTDRIFLHLKDNDQQLAEQFINKHSLNRMLKKHIHQKIKLSRQAVVQDTQKISVQGQDTNQNDSQEIFSTPIQKRYQKPIQQFQNQTNKKRNPLHQMEFEKRNNQIYAQGKYFKENQKYKLLLNDRKFSQQNFLNHAQQMPQNNVHQSQNYDNYTESKFNSGSQLPSYIKKQNLYDISGLKLKTTQPPKNSIGSFINDKINQKGSETLTQQGLLQRQILLKNTQKPVFQLKKNSVPSTNKDQFFSINNDFDVYRKQKSIQNFIEVSQKEHPYFQSNNFRHLDQEKKNKQKLQQRIESYQQQTKFSSIDKEQAEYTEDNYISFNVPYPEPVTQINQNKSSPKKAGSIRSNVKQPLDSLYYGNESSQKNNQVYQNSSKKSHHLNQNLFDDSKNFRNLTIKGQQNIQTNSHYIDVNSQFDEKSWRPSRVKFYGKEEIKSLRQSTMSKSLSRTEVSRINKAVTNRLYNEQEIKKKYLNQLKARARNMKEQQNQQDQQLTYRPEINLLSKVLAQKRNKNQMPLQDYLIEQGKLLQQKRQNKIQLQTKRSLQNCSFHPRISQNSKKLVSLQKSRSKSRVSSNLSQLNRCSSSRKMQPQAPTFHPQINKLSQQIAKSKGNFIQRQKTFQEQKNSKLFKKQQQERLKQKIDPLNGQKLFQPHLTEKSIKLAQHYNQENRQISEKSIHSYLYELSKIPKKQEKLNPKPYINPQSQKLISQLHEKRINWLFLQLDSDEDGIISNCKISIDNIPTQMLEIIAPVLYEMEDLQTELNLQDFRNAIKNLTKGLDPWQKSILYGYGTAARV